MGVDQIGDDREAESAAAGIRSAGVVEAAKAFEHSRSVLLGDTLAVVFHDKLRGRPVDATNTMHSYGDAMVRVSFGIVNEVSKNASQRIRVAGNEAILCLNAPFDPRKSGSSSELRPNEVPQIDGLHVCWSMIIVAGEKQEVSDQAFEAVMIGDHVRNAVGPTPVGVVDGGDFKLISQRRKRAPEFVAGVTHESLLAHERGLQSVEHVVHGDRETIDLVSGARERYTPRQVAR